jgi:hypothetical protein
MLKNRCKKEKTAAAKVSRHGRLPFPSFTSKFTAHAAVCFSRENAVLQLTVFKT